MFTGAEVVAGPVGGGEVGEAAGVEGAAAGDETGGLDAALDGCFFAVPDTNRKMASAASASTVTAKAAIRWRDVSSMTFRSSGVEWGSRRLPWACGYDPGIRVPDDGVTSGAGLAAARTAWGPGPRWTHRSRQTLRSGPGHRCRSPGNRRRAPG